MWTSILRTCVLAFSLNVSACCGPPERVMVNPGLRPPPTPTALRKIEISGLKTWVPISADLTEAEYQDLRARQLWEDEVEAARLRIDKRNKRESGEGE